MVQDDEREVGDRRARPRLVVASGCRQHGVRHVGDQQPSLQAADARHYGNDFIAEMRAQGLPTAEINKRLRARDNEVPEESDEIRYMVYAFDATTGALQWEREAHKGLAVRRAASEEHVRIGNAVHRRRARLRVIRPEHRVFAYTLDGDLVWKRAWQPQPIYLDFGTGTSPIVHDGRVYLLQDSEKECYLTALDSKDGADVWR
jgi:outer membrane protein assembly factor BamB